MSTGETEVASDGSHLHIPVFRGPWVDRVIFVESDRVAVEMAKLRPYLVLINAKSVPQTVRQIAVRYDEQYDARKPTCKVGSESADVVDETRESSPSLLPRRGAILVH